MKIPKNSRKPWTQAEVKQLAQEGKGNTPMAGHKHISTKMRYVEGGADPMVGERQHSNLRMGLLRQD